MDLNRVIEMYTQEEMSTHAIAKHFGTYPNKIRRTLVSNGVELRDKSNAQKKALESGRSAHPTKGKQRTDEEKDKISMSVEKAWASLSKKERKRLKDRAKELWDMKSQSEKEEFRKQGSVALFATMKQGSKAERGLYEKLSSSGYEVQLHKKGLIEGKKYEIDLFLPEISTIIEIDGPQHFRPVFGEKNLREYVKHDIIKNGMMLKKGYCVIRIKYLCNTYSRSVDRRLWDLVEPVVNKISKKFPPEAKRLIELEIS